MAFLAWTLCQAALALVLFASNVVFTFFLRVLIFPLLVAAVAGYGMAWLISRLAGRLPRAAATDELQGRCNDGAKCRAGRNLLGLSKMRGAVAARCVARDRRRDALVAAVRRDCDRHACAPARECGIVAGVDAAPASRRNRHCQEQGSRPGGLSGSLAAGQKTCVRAGGLSLHAAHCDAPQHPQDSTSLPADQTSLCTSRRHRCRKPELSLTRRASRPMGTWAVNHLSGKVPARRVAVRDNSGGKGPADGDARDIANGGR